MWWDVPHHLVQRVGQDAEGVPRAGSIWLGVGVVLLSLTDRVYKWQNHPSSKSAIYLKYYTSLFIPLIKHVILRYTF